MVSTVQYTPPLITGNHCAKMHANAFILAIPHQYHHVQAGSFSPPISTKTSMETSAGQKQLHVLETRKNVGECFTK